MRWAWRCLQHWRVFVACTKLCKLIIDAAFSGPCAPPMYAYALYMGIYSYIIPCVPEIKKLHCYSSGVSAHPMLFKPCVPRFKAIFSRKSFWSIKNHVEICLLCTVENNAILVVHTMQYTILDTKLNNKSVIPTINSNWNEWNRICIVTPLQFR